MDSSQYGLYIMLSVPVGFSVSLSQLQYGPMLYIPLNTSAGQACLQLLITFWLHFKVPFIVVAEVPFLRQNVYTSTHIQFPALSDNLQS